MMLVYDLIAQIGKEASLNIRKNMMLSNIKPLFLSVFSLFFFFFPSLCLPNSIRPSYLGQHHAQYPILPPVLIFIKLCIFSLNWIVNPLKTGNLPIVFLVTESWSIKKGEC